MGPSSIEDLVFRYFELMKEKDIDQLLDLFAEDSVIYEPFSRSLGLKNRLTIESFLAVTLTITEDLDYIIQIEKKGHNGTSNEVTALITYQRGGILRHRYIFEFTPHDFDARKIRSLHIQIPA